jgi:undecaprenyl-diphosphatase
VPDPATLVAPSFHPPGRAAPWLTDWRRGVRLPLPLPWRRRVSAFDLAVDHAFDRIRGTKVTDQVFYSASELGEWSLIWHLLSSARALAPDRTADDAVRLVAILGAESLLVNQGIKRLFRRTRPVWDQPRAFAIRRPLTSSFPSGHASAAFAAATVLGEDDPLAPLYYAMATVVAASRVYVKIHHASDVAAGVVTGLVLGHTARRLWPRDRPISRSGKVSTP